MGRSFHLSKDNKVEFPSEKDLKNGDSQAKQPQKKVHDTTAQHAVTDKADPKSETLAETKADLEEVLQTDDANVPKLQAELTELKEKNDHLEDQFLRAQAEIRNMANRNKKEQEQLAKYDGQRLAKDILPVLDNLERALAVEVKDDHGQQLKKGIEMVYTAMQNALKDNNITEIKAQGEKFDPTLHQAVQTTPKTPDQESDTVVQVLQRGYLLKDRVLRPAMVVVAQ
ncbi:nucleotide exchange factor GrpE [Agrilactobacillus composti]|uniref:nucleotide exchange factor GrpE n=1 Tax=Agrilactobacillus composti TaxID=398555 RepID=UPI00054EFDCD